MNEKIGRDLPDLNRALGFCRGQLEKELADGGLLHELTDEQKSGVAEAIKALADAETSDMIRRYQWRHYGE